jgi:hypothetical protein
MFPPPTFGSHNYIVRHSQFILEAELGEPKVGPISLKWNEPTNLFDQGFFPAASHVSPTTFDSHNYIVCHSQFILQVELGEAKVEPIKLKWNQFYNDLSQKTSSIWTISFVTNLFSTSRHNFGTSLQTFSVKPQGGCIDKIKSLG